MLLRLKIEQTPDGLTATISKRGEDGKSTAPPAVFFVRDKEEAKRRAKAMARARAERRTASSIRPAKEILPKRRLPMRRARPAGQAVKL